MGRVFVWVFACLVVLSRAGGAQACGGSYVVAPGDSLSLIAARHYQNAFVWVDIYASNRAVIGDDPDTILKGTQLSLPCLGEKPDPRPLARNAALMVPPPLRPKDYREIP